ncbi:MAG: aspartate kinase [Pirellulales bacterium]
MFITIKFGGTSVGDAGRIRKAAELVAAEVAAGHKVVVVTSAMTGVTNKLVALVQAKPGPPVEEQTRVMEFFHFTKELEQKHIQTARECISNPKLVDETANTLYSERHALERVLLGAHFLGEDQIQEGTIGYDFVVSQGERLCVPILANCLRDLGVDAAAVGSEGCGIMTDSNYGNARPLEPQTRNGVRQTLLPLINTGKTPVAGGFYGRSPQGRYATLGRGGSDYSATLVGAALDCDEIWIMTDVDGIKTTDPRVVPSARAIDEMPYMIAAEMALLGAKVLHPKSVLPAAKQDIPLRVASSFEPAKPGTRLVPTRPGTGPGVAGLTLVRKAGLICMTTAHLGDKGVIPAAMIDDIRRNNTDILASSSASNGSSVLWLVGPLDLERFLSIVEQRKDPHVQAEIRRDVAVLGIVGEQAARAPGILARVANCLEQVGAQPLAWLQGASPNSIAIALPDDDEKLPAMMRALHSTFGLDKGA